MVCRKIEPNTPFSDYYYFEDGDEQYRENAVRCKNLLDKLNELQIYESRKHTWNYVCWYVSFKSLYEKKICLILRFEIRKTNICIYFQSSKYVSKEKLVHGEKVDPHTNWLPVYYNNYDELQLREMIDEYLRKIKRNWEEIEEHCQKRHPCENCKKQVTS